MLLLREWVTRKGKLAYQSTAKKNKKKLKLILHSNSILKI